ncbi:Maltose transport MAL31 [Hyphodiscus hymeniophilus]|uniref:Maltose transport MAL31 n=1 Tax=Hyphodiscus hymeniophilus TaxID=353542 RepID=A0A9P7AUN3_9HELO|nr:Maltose transport MAL31 [Hyphodiscus hymeniophilus]
MDDKLPENAADKTTQVRSHALQAEDAAAAEHALTIRDAIKLYTPAIFWSLLFALGVVISGFDPQIVGTLVAIPQFQQNFGQYDPSFDGYIVRAQWQSAFNLGVPVGSVVGALGIGIPMERWGRRWAMAGCCILSCVAVAIQFSTDKSKVQLVIAELLNGLVIGAYPVLAPAYISEVSPVVLRGIFTATINTAYVTGQLIASGVLAGTQSRPDKWSYEIPFACQWIFPVFILCLLPFCPESPWWLVRKGDNEGALHALKKLTHSSVDTNQLLVSIQHTNKLEEDAKETATWADCFKGSDLRRTLIATIIYSIQPLSGNYLITGYCVYFFELAGLNPDNAFDFGVGVLAVGFVGSILSWFLIARFGRRDIYNWGLVLLTILVFLVAILDVVPRSQSVIWAQSSMMLVYNFFYDLTIGPLGFVILSEISSTRLRGKTTAISICVNEVIYVACGVGIPYAINPDQGNLRGKLAFVFFGFSLASIVYCYFCLPETKGRTYAELDIMFLENTNTRDFKNYVFDTDGNRSTEGIVNNHDV